LAAFDLPPESLQHPVGPYFGPPLMQSICYATDRVSSGVQQYPGRSEPGPIPACRDRAVEQQVGTDRPEMPCGKVRHEESRPVTDYLAQVIEHFPKGVSVRHAGTVAVDQAGHHEQIKDLLGTGSTDVTLLDATDRPRLDLLAKLFEQLRPQGLSFRLAQLHRLVQVDGS
jgi:hypothetical protein